jgi:transcriptional regulator with XRE-family HTH domain
MRKALEAVETLKKAGLLFVPMPVLSEADHAELLQDMMRRFNDIEQGRQEPSSQELKNLLAIAIGVPVESIGDDELVTIVSLGRGLFLDEEFDTAARELAARIEGEIYTWSNENCLGGAVHE